MWYTPDIGILTAHLSVLSVPVDSGGTEYMFSA